MSSSTWQEIICLNLKERNEIFKLYEDKKFPLPIRQSFANFIEQEWAQYLTSDDTEIGNFVDCQPLVDNTKQYEWVRQFQTKLNQKIESEIQSNVNSYAIFRQAKEDITKMEPGELFRILKFCLSREKELLEMYSHPIYCRLKTVSNDVDMTKRNLLESPLDVLIQFFNNMMAVITALQKDILQMVSNLEINPLSAENGAGIKISISQLQMWSESMAEILTRFCTQISQYHDTPYDANRTQAIEHYKCQVANLLQQLLNSTLVVEKQPKEKLSKNAKISEMIVRHLCLHKVLQNTSSLEVQVRLYELDENPKTLLRDGRLVDSEEEDKALMKSNLSIRDLSGKLKEPIKFALIMEIPLTKDEKSEVYQARFNGCKFPTVNREPRERDNGKLVMEAKKYFYFKLHSNKTKFFSGGVTSRPFVITSHCSQDPKTAGKNFWDNHLVAKLPNRATRDCLESVPLPLVLRELEKQFKLETGRALSSDQVDYLKEKLIALHEVPKEQIGRQKEEHEVQILEKPFWKNNMKYNGKLLKFSFYSWFYGILDLVKTCLKGIWTDKQLQQCMLGFVGRSNAESKLRGCPAGTFVTRFSESTSGAITISYVGADGIYIGTCEPITKQDLQKYLIPKRFLKNAFAEKVIGLLNVKYVYQGSNMQPFNKEEAFEKYRLSPKDRCKEKLGYDPIIPSEQIVKLSLGPNGASSSSTDTYSNPSLSPSFGMEIDQDHQSSQNSDEVNEYRYNRNAEYTPQCFDHFDTDNYSQRSPQAAGVTGSHFQQDLAILEIFKTATPRNLSNTSNMAQSHFVSSAPIPTPDCQLDQPLLGNFENPQPQESQPMGYGNSLPTFGEAFENNQNNPSYSSNHTNVHGCQMMDRAESPHVVESLHTTHPFLSPGTDQDYSSSRPLTFTPDYQDIWNSFHT